MFAICATFRDEDGEVRTGQLADTFRIIVEGDEEVIEVDPLDDLTMDLAVVCLEGDTLVMHRVPSLALIEVKEVVPA